MNNQVHPSFLEGLAGMITILFIALKVLKYISWSWIWVVSPIWILASFYLGIVLGVIIQILFSRR